MAIEADLRVKELRGAVDDAVQQLRAATFTLVSVGLYLFVTGLGTADRDLLMGGRVKLPIFDVEVSLLSFYVLAPLVFVVLHTTVLNLCRLVARRLLRLQKELAAVEYRDFVIGLLYPYPLVERLTQSPSGRFMRLLLSLSIYCPIMAMPVVTLFWLELRFLPYQNGWITGWHVTLLILDVVLISHIWREAMEAPESDAADPAVQKGRPQGRSSGGNWAFAGYGAAFLASVAGLGLSLSLVFTSQFPVFGWGPWLDVRGETIALGSSSEGAAARNLAISDDELRLRLRALSEYQSQGPDYFTSIIEPGALRAGGAHLGRRSLRHANLMGASLVGADLAGADLTDADLSYADLRGAILIGATLNSAKLNFARLEAANLSNVHAVGADLAFAQLQGAVLYASDFTGADLQGAHLQFNSFKDRMPAAKDDVNHQEIKPPIFRGAILFGALLQGTPLEPFGISPQQIDARDADLREANLQGVKLALFDFEGANLSGFVLFPWEAADQHGQQSLCGKHIFGACTAKIDDSPNFSQLCYEAARIVTTDTWHWIGWQLEQLVTISFGDKTECAAKMKSPEEKMQPTAGGLYTVRDGDPCADGDTPPTDEVACKGTTTEAYFDDLSSYLDNLSSRMKKPSDWCGSDPTGDVGLCARAFAYWAYDMRCQYAKQRQTGLPSRRAMGVLTSESEQFGESIEGIFRTSGFEAPAFNPQSCSGQIPKMIPQVAKQSSSSDSTRIAALFLDTLSGLLGVARAD